jgi:zona occludens toxin
MAINAYVGVMGSGKSYEVVNSVILPAVLAGRRVVTNISGISPELILERCRKKSPNAALGEVLYVPIEAITKPGFFPIFDPPVAGFVCPGDLICIDEAWKFWDSSDTISDEHMDFFRMHRHYVAENGTSCDMSLMIQDMGSLHRKVKAVVEATFRMVKLKSLGFSKVYRVEVYEGHKLTKASRVDQHINKYDKSIFPLYQSYKGAVGKEAQMDSRQNILNKKSLWIGVFLLIVASFVSWYFLKKFFNPNEQSNQTITASTSANSATKTQTPTSVPLQNAATESAAGRIHGMAVIKNEAIVVVSVAGRYINLPASSLQGLPPFQFVLLDGVKVMR